jgi:AcrR family transcriptional regulator
MSTLDKPLRRDAERNRQRILEAARELFADRGLAVTLDDIAAHAGLGVGTVYRRFRSRDELVDALFEERLQDIMTLADEVFAIDDAWQGLITFIERMAELQAADRGLKEVVLGSARGHERLAAIKQQLRPRGEELVRRAKAQGQLRPDFDPSDLPLLQLMLSTVADVATPEHPQVWRRFLALVIDGMRVTGEGRMAMPEPALGFEALEQVMSRWRPAPVPRDCGPTP